MASPPCRFLFITTFKVGGYKLNDLQGTAFFFLTGIFLLIAIGYLRHCEKPMLFLHGTQDEYGGVAKLEKLSRRCVAPSR